MSAIATRLTAVFVVKRAVQSSRLPALGPSAAVFTFGMFPLSRDDPDST